MCAGVDLEVNPYGSLRASRRARHASVHMASPSPPRRTSSRLHPSSRSPKPDPDQSPLRDSSRALACSRSPGPAIGRATRSRRESLEPNPKPNGGSGSQAGRSLRSSLPRTDECGDPVLGLDLGLAPREARSHRGSAPLCEGVWGSSARHSAAPSSSEDRLDIELGRAGGHATGAASASAPCSIDDRGLAPAPGRAPPSAPGTTGRLRLRIALPRRGIVPAEGAAAARPRRAAAHRHGRYVEADSDGKGTDSDDLLPEHW